MKRRGVLGWAGALLLAGPGTARAAADIPWSRHTPMRITVSDQNLVELLRAIALENGLPIVVSEHVKGRVAGSFQSPPDKLFKDLCASYGLTWFYDGQLLYVHSMTEMSARQVALSSERFPRMRGMLAELGLDDARFPIRWFPPENHLLAFGPPSFLNRVEELAEIVEFGPSRPNSPVVARVYRLKHAWADDLNIQQGARQVMLPGVASLLRKTMLDAQPAAMPAAFAQAADEADPDLAAAPLSQIRLPLINAFGRPQNNKGSQGQDRTPPTDNKTRAGKKRQVAEAAPRRPASIEADPRINAVLVRDTRDRMALYDSLIQEMDIPLKLVEIEASIIDVDSDDSERTGVAWRLFNNRFDAGTGPSGAVPGGDAGDNVNRGADGIAGQPLGSANAVLPSAPGFISSVVAGSASRYFAATLDLLVRKGNARVSSQPRILTLDNNEAVLDSQQSFYVRVAGREQANLYEVSAGLHLRVIPQLVNVDGVDKVKLLVNIEDGAVSRTQVDQVPVVARKSLSTQAVINSGDSLLLGGYVIEESLDDKQKVPMLGDIPLLGRLFQRSSKAARRAERMFLITPRLLRP